MEKHTPARRAITDWMGNIRKTWCGPYAVATVCGTEYEPAYQVAKRARGKRHAKGITMTDLKKSCRRLGVKGEWISIEKATADTAEPKKKMKLEKFLPMLAPNKVYVINVTKHFLVVDTRDFTTIDNQNPEWVAMESTKHINKMVHNYFVVDNPQFDPKSNDAWLIEPLAASS
jgi:hypothetical protein